MATPERDFDQLIDSVLTEYSRVEPPPGAIERWLAHTADPLPRRRSFWILPAAAVLAVAIILLVLALGLRRSHRPQPIPQPRLTGEHITITMPNSVKAQPLTDEQKALIEMLAKDPKALGKLSPEQLQKLLQAQKEKHP